MNKHFFIFIFSVFIASVSQILLKKSANKKHVNIFFEYFNPLVIIGYLCFFISTILTVYAYKTIPLKYGPVIESLGFIFILLFDRFYFSVHISRQKIGGALLIIAGTVIFHLGEII